MDIRKLMEEHDEAVRYVIFGVLTVIVSWVSYAAFVLVGIDLAVSNILSWFTAVIFAFFVNKIYVFRHTGSSSLKLGEELLSFFAGRMLTGIIAALMFPALCAIGLGFTFLFIEGLFARGITSVVEIALNYIISKYFVFREEGGEVDNMLSKLLPKWFRELPAEMRTSVIKFIEIMAFAVIIFYTAFRFSGIDSEVGTLYFRYAEHMVSGEMPYSDFDAEYPPFAMLLILIPRLFSYSSFTYQVAFGAEVFVFLLIGVFWIYRIAEMYTDRPGKVVDFYIVFTIILLDFVLDRYDIFPMIMLLGAFYFFKKEKYNASWIMIALGTVTKLYPALIAPIFLIWLIHKKKYDTAVKGVLICLVIGILSMLPFFIADSSTMLSVLTYHMDRGLQTEAPISTVLMLLGNLGVIDISYIFNYGSDNILGDIPDTIAKFMMPAMVVCMLALYILYAVIGRRNQGFCAIHYAGFAAVMIFMLVNKVLSSQYLVWIIAFSAVTMAFTHGKEKKSVMWLFALSVAMTQLNLIVNYAFRDAGEEFTLLGILILLIRNILLIALAVMTFKLLLKPEAPDAQLAGQSDAVEEV